MDSSLLSTNHTRRWIALQIEVIDLSILQEIFSICLKMFSYHATEKNQLKGDKKIW